MSGKVVSCSPSDSIRIVGADGLAVQIPAAYVLAVDRVLTACRNGERKLTLTPSYGNWFAHMAPDSREDRPTPWGALVALAESLEADNAVHAAAGI